MGPLRFDRHPNKLPNQRARRRERRVVVDVGKTGLYEVELWYACPQKDLGAEIKLSFLDQSLISKISREVDPPLLTGFDRKQRTEGYVKYFEPMKMGNIQLKKGKGELKLQAKKIPGDQALEFRLLMINRIEKKKS